MDLRRELARRSRDTRWVVGVLAFLFVALTILYYLVQRGRELPATLVTNRVLLFALRNLNGLLIVVILFVLGRNLVKLWVERRSRILGARFKTKLVATYIGLSLVPVLVLFFYASELLQGSIDRWFSASLSNVLEKGNAVAQALQRTIEERNTNDAARMAAEIEGLDLADADTRAAVRTRLERWRAESRAEFIAVFDEDVFVNAVLDPLSGLTELPEVGRTLPREAAQKGRAGRVFESAGERGRLILGAAATPQPLGRRAAVVVVGTLLDPATAAPSAQLIEAFQSYRQIEIQKGDFRASYLLTFVLVTLLILLASSWMGLFLARRLMTPLQALGEAFRRVSSGDLDASVDVPADDEMKEVVASFHRMTSELRSSREEIERSNREQALANQALDSERSQVAAILENLAAGVIVLDRDERVSSANGAALRMLRVRSGDLVGKSLSETFDGDPRAILGRVEAPLDPPSDSPPGTTGGAATAASVSFPVAGTWRTFEVAATALPGEAGGRILVLDDLTDLIRAQKLATWTEAARRIAHEIKNPLTPIRLAAERLRARYRQADGDVGELIEPAVEIVVREVGNLQALVDEFARFARMPGANFVATDLAPLVADAIALFAEIKPGLEVAGDVAPDLGELWVDPEQLRRLLINLLDNAVEATDAPGRIEVSVASAGERIAIVVADSGRGIPAEDRGKLFLPFFSRKGRGSGMGLAIVQRIVTDHDGEIFVEENVPRGTRFRIVLPARGVSGSANAAAG